MIIGSKRMLSVSAPKETIFTSFLAFDKTSIIVVAVKKNESIQPR